MYGGFLHIIDGTPYAVKAARTVWTYTKSERIVRDDFRYLVIDGQPFFFFDNPGLEWINGIEKVTIDDEEIHGANLIGFEMSARVELSYVIGETKILTDFEESISEEYFITFNPRLFEGDQRYTIVIKSKGYPDVELEVDGGQIELKLS